LQIGWFQHILAWLLKTTVNNLIGIVMLVQSIIHIFPIIW